MQRSWKEKLRETKIERGDEKAAGVKNAKVGGDGGKSESGCARGQGGVHYAGAREGRGAEWILRDPGDTYESRDATGSLAGAAVEFFHRRLCWAVWGRLHAHAVALPLIGQDPTESGQGRLRTGLGTAGDKRRKSCTGAWRFCDRGAHWRGWWAAS